MLESFVDGKVRAMGYGGRDSIDESRSMVEWREGRRYYQNITIIAGNERAVRLSKQSGYINRGIQADGSPLRMDNAWMSWSFQCNFMYESVL